MGRKKQPPEPEPSAAVREPAPPPSPATEKRGMWGQALNPGFGHGRLLIPRAGRDDAERATFSPAAQARRATLRGGLELQRPTKSATATLRKLGLEDLRELEVIPAPVSKHGVFAPLDSLGVTAAFFREEADEDRARKALDDQYEFVPDFRLSLPCRVVMSDVPANRSRAARARERPGQGGGLWEWPAASGIAQAHARGIRAGLARFQ